MNSKFIVHVKAGSIKRSIEHFGGDRYLIKTDLTEHEQINKEVIMMLAKYTGVAPQKIQLFDGINREDKVFQII